MYWKCRDKNIEYGGRTLIMGIVNVTPDSFSDGGDCFSPDAAAAHALELEGDGADIIDIGGQSTRPGHTAVSDKEEWERIEPVLKALSGRLSVPLSVDTYYPYVAQRSLENGADIINDVGGEINTDTARLVKESGCGWIIMHSGHGTPQEVGDFFISAAEKCERLGIKREQLCFDMGIGFGKDYEENLALIANIPQYRAQGYPLLLGVSRKRVIGKSSRQDNPRLRVYGNIAADTAAILGGADIIRLHDVKNERQGILTADEIKARSASR